MKTLKFSILVQCAPSEEYRVYGWYVGYTYEKVQHIAENLPEDWDYEIQRD